MAGEQNARKTELIVLCMLAFVVVGMSQFTVSFSQGPNNRNVSVDTLVNITGSAPVIEAITVQTPITLGAGFGALVSCNVSILDYNGFADLDTVNGTFFHSSATIDDPDDNNTIYRNSSCAAIVGEESGNYANYTCTFPVQYYAEPGTWNCTVTVNDTINLTHVNSTLATINSLLALNVTTLIDYGEMAMGDTSTNQEANVSNMGNVPINVSVEGYGFAIDDGLSFVCDQGTLSVGLQRFAGNSSAVYADKQVLTATGQDIGLYSVAKATNASGTLNETYWQLYLDVAENAFGLCNGTVIFQAETFS